MFHRSQKGIQGLSRQGTSGNVRHGNRQHQRYLTSGFFHRQFSCPNSRLGIQCVKNSLNQQRIHSPFQQGFHLLTISCLQFIESQRAKSRVVYVRTHGASLVGRPHGTRHEARLFRIQCCKLIGHPACQTCCRKIDFPTISLHMIVGH